MRSKLIILTLISGLACEGANILGIVPSPSYSHQIAYFNLWKELSLKGHKVTVLTTDPQNNPNLTNLTEIDLSMGYDVLEKQFNWSAENREMSPLTYVHTMLQMICTLTDLYLSLPDVQRLINDESVRFDVVLAESFFSEFLMFGEFFNAPTIQLTSLDAAVPIHKLFLNDHHSFIYPETYIPYTGELTFKERLSSTLLVQVIDYIKSQYIPVRQKNIDKHFGNISLPVSVLLEKSSLLFIAVSPVLLYPRALAPRTIIVGVETTVQEPKELRKDMQEFLDSAEKGAIYFSLGSNARSENFAKGTIAGIFDVLKDLPYSILWKFHNNTEYKLPGNIMTDTWLPQQDILRHPNVKLFITQGGLQSLEEAIYFEKPMVAIPVFGDQFSNAKRLEPKGILKIVPSKPSLDPLALKAAILEVMGNSSYKENIKRLNEINLDQPMTGTERAIWWIEYVIRHKGNVEHMVHAPAKNVPFYQYYFLDIIAFFFVVVLGILGLLYLMAAFLYKLLLRIIKNMGTDKNKKQN